MASYASTSPYSNTKSFGSFLDIWSARPITKDPSDVLYSLDQIYKYRPDLLAFDLYGDPGLWWVFIVRNPNVFRDPVFDFLPGVTFYIPKKQTLDLDLGL